MKKRMFFCYAVIFLLCFSMLGSFADGIGTQSSFIDEEATVNAVSSAVSDGIKSFQRYINNNLPMSYLGTALDVDGGCGPLTKTAIIKLVQYRLNQAGAGLSVDGGFGVQSQAAFQKYVGKIKRYDSGVWVYILQGLLYCHGYNPNGFDGSYGVNGGTGCLNAVNSYKSSNNIGGTSGEVDIDTMRSLLWRDDYVNIWTNAAKYLSLSRGISGGFTYANDLDCFLFKPTQSMAIYIYTMGSSDTKGAIYSVNLSNKTRTLLQSDDNSGQSNNFLIRANVSLGQTYLIEVDGKSAASGSYNLFITNADTTDSYAGLQCLTQTYTGISAQIKTPTSYPYIRVGTGESCWVQAFNNNNNIHSYFKVGIKYTSSDTSKFIVYSERKIGNADVKVVNHSSQNLNTTATYKLEYLSSDSNWHAYVNGVDRGNASMGQNQMLSASADCNNTSIAMGPFEFHNVQTKTASGGWVYNSSSVFHQNNPYRVSTINNNANFKAYGPAVG